MIQMSRILNISDQMLLYNILDVIEPHKQSESVAYLQSIYGIENLQEYVEVDKYEYLDLFTYDEIVTYFGEELLSEYEDYDLLSWVDKDYLYKTVDLEDVISNNKPMEVLDCLFDTDIIKYLELKGYKVGE